MHIWFSTIKVSLVHKGSQKGQTSLLSEAIHPAASWMWLLPTRIRVPDTGSGSPWQCDQDFFFFKSHALSADASLNIKRSKAEGRYVLKPWRPFQVSFIIFLTSLNFWEQKHILIYTTSLLVSCSENTRKILSIQQIWMDHLLWVTHHSM